MRIINQRIISSDGIRFFGVFLENNVPFAVWLAPANMTPCGEWFMAIHNGAEWKNVWEYQNVAGRTDMLIHSGNKVSDSKGCTIIGTNFGIMDGEPAVLQSKDALADFMNRTKGETQIKVIIEKPMNNVWEA